MVVLSRCRAARDHEPVAVLALLIGMGASLLPRIQHGMDGIPQPASRLLAAGALAVAAMALAIPDLQRTRRRAALRRLAARVAAAPAPGQLAGELARAVGDPTVSIAFPTADGPLVDHDGLPLGDSWATGRSVTNIMREGRHLATVAHRAGSLDDDGDVTSLTRMAGLAIEHERARAERTAQLRELRASRRRLVEASDRERRRLEHDLHDGAQQRLVFLLLAMRSTTAPPAAAAKLADAEQHLQAAIAELRTLTHGLYPPMLETEGLAPAIEDLELSSTTIVEILELPSHRAPPLVESTAYLAAALAVDSTETTVQLRIRQTPDAVVVDAHGTTPGDSLEWRALAERVAALEGLLVTTSDEMRVTLPCAW
jgi:signal transduction histidine kinase